MTNKIKMLTVMIEALQELKELKPTMNPFTRWDNKKKLSYQVHSNGVCSYLYKRLLAVEGGKEFMSKGISYILIPYFRTWESFSGEDCYPIPSCDTMSQESKFYNSDFDAMWFTGNYARFRWDLIDHLILEMELDKDL